MKKLTTSQEILYWLIWLAVATGCLWIIKYFLLSLF